MRPARMSMSCPACGRGGLRSGVVATRAGIARTRAQRSAGAAGLQAPGRGGRLRTCRAAQPGRAHTATVDGAGGRGHAAASPCRHGGETSQARVGLRLHRLALQPVAVRAGGGGILGRRRHDGMSRARCGNFVAALQARNAHARHQMRRVRASAFSYGAPVSVQSHGDVTSWTIGMKATLRRVGGSVMVAHTARPAGEAAASSWQ